jgi:dTDP-4-dehydrorhamnose reductase
LLIAAPLPKVLRLVAEEKTMKILVAGADGQLARALRACARSSRGHLLLTRGRPELDLANPSSLANVVGALRPDLIVNAAAYTAVDNAEREQALAFAINRDGAGALAAVAAHHDCPIIQISTDYVFDGAKLGAYCEDDATRPTGVYGCSKLEGEMAVAAANARHIILRTSWVYAAQGGNFVRTILRLAREQPELRVVADQRGNPTYAPHLAEVILLLADRIKVETATAWGIYHAAGRGDTTWHEFAVAILEAAVVLGIAEVPVRPVTTAEFPRPARRPANSCLDCGKLERAFGVRLPHWRQGLAACIAELEAAAKAP